MTGTASCKCFWKSTSRPARLRLELQRQPRTSSSSRRGRHYRQQEQEVAAAAASRCMACRSMPSAVVRRCCWMKQWQSSFATSGADR